MLALLLNAACLRQRRCHGAKTGVGMSGVVLGLVCCQTQENAAMGCVLFLAICLACYMLLLLTMLLPQQPHL
jgi:hypothetical protein